MVLHEPAAPCQTDGDIMANAREVAAFKGRISSPDCAIVKDACKCPLNEVSFWLFGNWRPNDQRNSESVKYR